MGIECGADGCRGFGNAVGVGSFATSLLVLAGLLVVVYVVVFLAMEVGAAVSRVRPSQAPVRRDVPRVLSRGLRWSPEAPGGPAWVDQDRSRAAAAVSAGEVSA